MKPNYISKKNSSIINSPLSILHCIALFMILMLIGGCGSKGGKDEGVTPDATEVTIGSVKLFSDVSTLVADGESKAIITAEVRSDDDDPIKDVSVVFTDITEKDITDISSGNTFTGTGDKITSAFYSSGGIVTFTVNYAGTRYNRISVQLWNQDTNDRYYIMSESGQITDAQYLENLVPGYYFLEVEADAYWSVTTEGAVGGSPDDSEDDNKLATVKTDSKGRATYTYTSSKVKQVVTIQAEADTITKKISLSQIAGDPVQIEVSADPVFANGVNKTRVEAKVRDENNNLVGNDVSVKFTTTAGIFRTDSGSEATEIFINTREGIAAVNLIPPQSSSDGFATVTAEFEEPDTGEEQRAAGTGQRSVTITVPFMGISLSDITSGWLVQNEDGTKSSKIRVYLKDANGAAVPDETIRFSTDKGTLKSQDVKTDENGIAEAELFAPVPPDTATVTASYGELSLQTSVSFTQGSGAASITLEPEFIEIPADGKSSVKITAELSNNAGMPVESNTPVSFSTSMGTFGNGSEIYTTSIPDTSGFITVSLIADTNPGIANVICTSGGVSQKISIKFTGSGTEQVPATITLTPASGTVTIPADGTSSTPITAEVKDASGNAVSGVTVTFSTSRGTIPTSAQTDDNGKVIVSLTASASSGVAEITCRAGGISQKTTVEFAGGSDAVPATISLTSAATSIPADGRSSVSITADVRDSSGSPVPRGTVLTFSTTLGSIPSSSQADANGRAIVSLTSSLTSGVAEVTCRAGSVTQKTTVEFKGGSDSAVATISLSAEKSEIPADGKSSTSITATLKDSFGQAVPKGTSVSFSTSLGRIPNSTGYTNDSGMLTVALISGTTAGSAEITCWAGSVSQKVTVEFTKDTGPVTAAKLSLLSSQNTVKSDNSDKAELTAVALDADNAAVEDVTINFSAEEGYLSSSSVKTGADGTAKVSFSAGDTKKNQTVRITASAGSLQDVVLVKIDGTTMDMTSTGTDLGTATLTVQVKDAGDKAVQDAEVSIKSVDPEDGITENDMLQFSLVDATSYKTDVNGELKVSVKGGSERGKAMARVECAGVSKTQSYTVSSGGEAFSIIEPSEDMVSLHTKEELLITVSAPGREFVKFITTFGQWKGSGEKLLNHVPVVNGKASAVLISEEEAGWATVQVLDEATPSVSDTLEVAISASLDKNATISIQASATNLTPSTGDEINKVDIIATVRNKAGQGVGGAPVVFSIENTTGGGESISPVYVLTDDKGVAKSVFSSGSLSSDAEGVKINASIAGTAINKSVSVIIRESAASLFISAASKVASVNNNTGYELPMSVLVTDANGSPAADTTISLSLWPLRYATGYWDTCATGSGTCIYHLSRHPNEDENKNLINDPGEDKNGDEKLTPPSSAAGAIPESVKTDENGVATFELIYPKQSAGWIEAEITASVVVSGTETKSSYKQWLGWLEGEEDNLSPSPYNPEDIWLETGYVTVKASPASMTADGKTESKIRAEVFDYNRNKIEDPVTVIFTTSGGTLSPASAETIKGEALTVLTAPTYSGTATVTATVEGYEDVSGTAELTFKPDVPAKETTTVTVESSNLTADGKSSTEITARVADKNGNIVADGSVIIFEVTQGTGIISPKTVPTSGGVAKADYTASTTKGNVQITAKTADGTVLGTVNIQLIEAVVGSVSVKAGSASIIANGTSQTLITATVTDTDNSPVPEGTEVTFTTTSGQISGVTKTVNGNATAMLTSSRHVGTATVTATAGGVSETVQVQFTAGSVASGGISLSASPDTLLADGKTTSQIRALVKDANGNPVTGEVISFSVSSDMGMLSAQTATTSGGVATVTYTSGIRAGQVTITAKSANGVTAQVMLYLSPTDVGRIDVSAQPDEIDADGVSTSRITATVLDERGEPVTGAPVVFEDTTDLIPSVSLPSGNTYRGSGPSTASSFHSNGGLTGFVFSHTGTVKLTVYLQNDDTNVRELLQTKAGTFIDERIEKELEPANYHLEVTESDGDWTVQIDGSIEKVPEGAAIKLLCNGSGDDTYTDSSGNAYCTYTSTKIKKVVSIRAKCGDLEDTVSIKQTAGVPTSMDLSSDVDKVYANGVNAIKISAKVRDANNNLAGDGTDVTFETDLGTFEDATIATKDGIAVATLISPISDEDLAPGERDRRAAVSAAAIVGNQRVEKEIEVEFLWVSLFSAEGNPPSVTANGEDESTITVHLNDAKGVAVEGETIKFETASGTLTASSAETDEKGIAKVTLIASDEPDDSVTVTATYGKNPEATAFIKFKAEAKPKISTLKVEIDSEGGLPADGESTAKIYATLTVEGGGAVPITSVKFTIIEGEGNFGGKKTTTLNSDDGVATATLTSGLQAGTAIIRVEAETLTEEIEVKYTSGSISMMIIPNSILGTGRGVSQITATVRSVDGNLVAEGEEVSFFLNNQSLGEFETASVLTNKFGEAKVKFFGSNKGGRAVITARWAEDVEGSETIVIQSPPAFINMVEDAADFPNPNPKSVSIRGTGGQSTSQIFFEVMDEEGKPVAEGYPIDFAILTGPDGGEVISPLSSTTFIYTEGEITYETNDFCTGCCAGHGGLVVCTDEGIARCADGTSLDEDCRIRGCVCERADTGNDKPGRVGTVLRSGFKPGPVSIKATYRYDSNVTTATSQIAIEAGPPVGEEFGISADYINIGGAGVKNNVWVTAGDFWGNAIPNNTAISFKTYNTGGLIEPGSAVTSGGVAQSVLNSTSAPVPMQGFGSVTAEVINGGRTTHVTALSVVPETEHTQILYAGTNGGGVYKSTDSGTTWENISRSSSIQGQNWLDPYVNDVAADPDNPNTVYAVTGYLGEGKVFRSLDGGLNWNSNSPEEFNGIFRQDAAILTVLCDDDGSDTEPEHDRYVWIGTEGYGAYVASDGKHFRWGDTVTPISPTAENASGSFENPGNTGTGYMIRPELSPSSKNETWTVIYACTEADCVSGSWLVTGSQSGVQTLKAFSDAAYQSDNEEVSFTIVEQGASRGFAEGDVFEFQVTQSNLGYGAYVQDIVKVPGTHRDSAVLYAGTSTNVFKSSNGGGTWTKQGSFTGDYITVVALHPDAGGGSSDILYAGTKDSGVWVSNDSGLSWTSYASGMGKGLSASLPLRGNTNEGYGVVKDNKVKVYPGCLSENWTVRCIEEVSGAGIFSVTGTVSGSQADYDISAGTYQIPNVFEFTIIDGSVSDGSGGFKEGDTFTFTTTRDPGRHIKDLMADPANNLLYALTYFMGTLEPHPVGNVYIHDLNPDGTMAPGDWREANTGLPEYDPPDDTTLFAQHVIAPNIPSNPTALYIGGEGINFFKATSGIDSGEPQWQESKSGLSNLIMSRMPILFSQECQLTVIPDIDPSEFNVGDIVTFKMYVQDKNGNPPVYGSKVEARLIGDETNVTIFTNEYSDAYTYSGTWRDPTNPATNDPFTFSTRIYYEAVVVTFTPVCGNAAPGCSGKEQSYSYIP